MKNSEARRIAQEKQMIYRPDAKASAFAFWAMGFATAAVIFGTMAAHVAWHYTLQPRAGTIWELSR